MTLSFRVSPGARKTSIGGAYGEKAPKPRVAAPPVDGRANAEAESFVAGLLGLPRSQVEVIRGASGRDKVILVRGAELREVRGSLAAFVG